MDLVDNLATLLLKVADASEREQEFRDRLITGGVMFTAQLRPMPFRGDFKEIRSPNGMLARWFSDAAYHGILNMDHIPQPWRDRWFKDQAPERS
jgi:hypothetical protein